MVKDGEVHPETGDCKRIDGSYRLPREILRARADQAVLFRQLGKTRWGGRGSAGGFKSAPGGRGFVCFQLSAFQGRVARSRSRAGEDNRSWSRAFAKVGGTEATHS